MRHASLPATGRGQCAPGVQDRDPWSRQLRPQERTRPGRCLPLAVRRDSAPGPPARWDCQRFL